MVINSVIFHLFEVSLSKPHASKLVQVFYLHKYTKLMVRVMLICKCLCVSPIFVAIE